jgi:hypothetical protein
MSETVLLPTAPTEAEPPGAALTRDSLGALLGTLASRPGLVPKYLYPSAGTLYPVRAYVFLRNPVGDLTVGGWYYDPDTHALVAMSATAPLAPDGSMPEAMLVLAAHRPAIAPIYGGEADRFCLLEAGYMAAALKGADLRLRNAGDAAMLTGDPALEEGDVPLVCWAIEGVA